MTQAPRLLGAVLAGGEGRRLGRPKGAVNIGGVTLVERAAATLEGAFGDVVVVSSLGEAPGWRTVPDRRPGLGPLAGIESALEVALADGFDGVFVLACDLPMVRSEDAEAVRRALVGAAAAPARDGEPGFEPLCAAYRVSCLEAVRSLLDDGERAAQSLFSAVGGATVELPGAAFLNVNTPEDAAAAEALLRSDDE